jgi:hypothetical protein
MKEPKRADEVEPPPRQRSWTTIGLVSGLVLLAVILAYVLTRGNSEEDKLTNRTVSLGNPAPSARERLCGESATYDLIKRELFRRAAKLRGSDQAAFDRLASAAVIRMENPVMESEDATTGGVNCSGSVALDLPPGVEVVGGRRTLTSDLDYMVTSAADGSGPVVLLKNADAIVTPLATVAQISQSPAEVSQQPAQENGAGAETAAPSTQPMPTVERPQPPPPPPQVQAPGSQRIRTATARPSFDCTRARTRGEIAVCSEAGLAALDRQMAAQYARAFALASPEQRDILRESARRFYAYRDRCPTNACIGDAYTGRIQEIRDIMEGRWQPAQ